MTTTKLNLTQITEKIEALESEGLRWEIHCTESSSLLVWWVKDSSVRNCYRQRCTTERQVVALLRRGVIEAHEDRVRKCGVYVPAGSQSPESPGFIFTFSDQH